MEGTGDESYQDRYHTFLPLAQGVENEDKAEVIMENFFLAFGQSP